MYANKIKVHFDGWLPNISTVASHSVMASQIAATRQFIRRIGQANNEEEVRV